MGLYVSEYQIGLKVHLKILFIIFDYQGKYLRLAYSDNMNSEWKISKTKILEIKKFKKIFCMIILFLQKYI